MGKKIVKTIWALTIHFAAMGNIKNLYNPCLIVNSVDYPVVSDAQAVIRSIAQFLTAKRPGIIFQREKFGGNAVLQRYRKFSELMFGAGDYFNAVIHQARFSLRSSVKKLLKGREAWRLRVSAIVKSMISSLKRVLWMSPNNIAFCSALGNALNAVRKTSAFACIVVIIEPPLYNKFITGVDGCQGVNRLLAISCQQGLVR